MQIVQRIYRHDEIERLIGKGQRRSRPNLDAVLHLVLGVGDGVLRNVDAARIGTGHDLHEIVDQEAFAATDIQDLVAGLESVMIGHGLGDLGPAAVVTIATVIDAAVAVPVVEGPLLGERAGLRFGKFRVVDAPEVVALRALMNSLTENLHTPCAFTRLQCGKSRRRFFQLCPLALGIVAQRIGEIAGLGAFDDIRVEHDAAPLHGEDRLQQFDAAFMPVRAKPLDGRPHERLIEFSVNRNLRLKKKVRNHLGRIVPASVFEIDEAKTAIGALQRVVETEVGGGHAALLHRQYFVDRQRQFARPSRDRRLQVLPIVMQFAKQGACRGVAAVHLICAEQPVDAAIDQCEMLGDAEAGLRRTWQIFGLGSPRRVVENVKELRRGEHVALFDFGRSQFAARNPFVYGDLAGLVRRDRSRDAGNVVAICVIDE